MLLFENFTYDEEFAKANYDNFNHDSIYLDSVIRDYAFVDSIKDLSKRELYFFSVSRYSSIDGVKNIYKITRSVHKAWEEDPDFTPAQIEYLKKRLAILGDAVKILIPHYKGSMIFQYFIEKDEYRWDKAQKKIEKYNQEFNSIQVQEPTFEDWYFMIDNMYSRNNPNLIFKKIKTLDELLRKWVVAIKLKWVEANRGLNTRCVHFYKKDSWEWSQKAFKAVQIYAKTCEPNEKVQKLLSQYQKSSKCQTSIPKKLELICEILDASDLVKRYEIIRGHNIEKSQLIFVEMVNGKSAYIVFRDSGGGRWSYKYQLQAYLPPIENVMKKVYSIGRDFCWGDKIEEVSKTYTPMIIEDIFNYEE